MSTPKTWNEIRQYFSGMRCKVAYAVHPVWNERGLFVELPESRYNTVLVLRQCTAWFFREGEWVFDHPKASRYKKFTGWPYAPCVADQYDLLATIWIPLNNEYVDDLPDLQNPDD